MLRDFQPETKTLLIIALVAVVLSVAGILLLRGLSPTSTPSPQAQVLDTSTWQTYRNEEVGFELQYPEDWKIKVNDAYGIVEIASYELDPYFDHGAVPFPPKGQAHIALYVDVLATDPDFNEGWKKISPTEGLSGVLLERRVVLSEGEKKMLAKQRYWEGDPSTEKFDKLFDQILSTFRFVEK